MDVGRNDVHPQIQRFGTMVATATISDGGVRRVVSESPLPPLDRLAVGELHQVSIGIANDCEVADGFSCVGWGNGKNSELPAFFGNLVHLFSPLTLKPKMVHA